jgi:hypothetical protein
MSIKKLSFMLLSAISLAALLNGCGSSSKDGSPGGVAKVADEGVCIHCHSTTLDTKTGTNIVNEYAQSGHNPKIGSSHSPGCEGCHGGGSQHNGVGPLPYPDPLKVATSLNLKDSNGNVVTTVCETCHTGNYDQPSTLFTKGAGNFKTNCANCHTASGVGSIHGVIPVATMLATKDCVSCHSVAAPQHMVDGVALVNDNDGVRAITGDFQKWSHHVTGVDVNAAHCAACHLEGKADENGKIVVDETKHMADAKIHLRNANDDSDFAWDPAAPDFTDMDTFCLNCHNSSGAISRGSAAIQAVINNTGLAAAGKTASPTNPFGDTISNQYDKLQRPAVVDAKGQFATGNNSHHAVLGKKYSGRTRVAGTRQISSPTTFAANSSAALPGVRTTIYDAGKFESTYTTLADATGESTTRNGGTTLGDDSTLHCGDCHTVGQFSTKQADYNTRYNKAAIGAHGSNNEYLLRNNAGTNARHYGVKYDGTINAGWGNAVGVDASGNLTGAEAYLVCFNCHKFKTYGSTYAVSGRAGGSHAGEYANNDRCNGPWNTLTDNTIGAGRIDGVKTNNNGTQTGVLSGNAFSNAFGIQCANCHNSGTTAGNIFGGIHGSKDQTYTDGMGNTSKHFRFMPGLGNVMYVPGTRGGITGGSTAMYAVYSGNRNGTGNTAGSSWHTTGQTFTMLAPQGVVPGTASTTYEAALATNAPQRASYQYTTGGVSSDLNWEQKSAQPISGQYDYSAKAMGCYTLTPTGVLKLTAAGNGRDALGAADNIQAGVAGPDGTTGMFDNWGGCDDHNAAQGAGTAPFRNVLRKTTY